MGRPHAEFVHITSTTNPNLNLHQEFAMRTRGYDDIATVTVGGVRRPFAQVVAEIGIEEAIREVEKCWWISDFELESERNPKTDLEKIVTERVGDVIYVDCRSCLEVGMVIRRSVWSTSFVARHLSGLERVGPASGVEPLTPTQRWARGSVLRAA